jgi:mRNA-degrading endonuclease RelE of RelBE toxin-antitoxin system
MPMAFQIKLTTDAEGDLAYFKAREQRIILEGIKTHLQVEADQESKRRKKLGLNPLAPWELRIDNYRVFYEVEEIRTVWIIAIGWKEHNDLYIRGDKVSL